MTVVSLAQAARRLGIDAKTLRRWLADAQLCLTRHPADGRKLGLSEEQLQQLAHLHQRSLAPLSQPSSTPPEPLAPSLAGVLLALPEQLAALQAQLARLQQQVSELTHRLPPSTPVPTPASQQLPTRTRSSAPTPPARPTRSAAKAPRKSVHVIPRVEYGSDGHYVVICPTRGRLPFEPDTPEWFAWLATQTSFRFVGKAGHFTAHHEQRLKHAAAWRAHRHIRNHVSTLRLAPAAELTIAVLERAAETLHAQVTAQ